MTRQLEIGPGDCRLPGEWTTLDCVARPGIVDQVARWGAEPLPFPDESFELIYAAHVLEHIPWYETVAALTEAARILVPGGRLELHVPDLAVLVRAIDAQCCPDYHVEQNLNQELHWMHWAAERLFHLGPAEAWHRACFNDAHLRWCLARAGFVEPERLDHERGADHGVINLGLAARKPTAAPPSAPPVQTPRPEVRPIAQVSSSLAGVDRASFLPACHSRREDAAEPGVFFCAHPQVHVARHLVSREICARCDRWREAAPEEFRPYRSELGALHDGPCWHLGAPIGWRPCATCRGTVRLKVLECLHPRHGSTTAQACLGCSDYEQRLRRGTITQWAVGLTTAPRATATLPATLLSLAAAGWTDVHLFAEPNSPLPDHVAPRAVTHRATTLGAWSNFLLGLVELCQLQPYADAYLMVQDDVQFCRNLRTYLERTLWPAEKLGVVTLYNPVTRAGQAPGFFDLASPDGLPGALALVLPNYAARLLMGDPYVLAHRRRGATNGTRLIDVVVGQWAARSGLPAVGHFPSLTQHVGDRTTIWGAAEDAAPRRSPTFVGPTFDALSLLAATTGA